MRNERNEIFVVVLTAHGERSEGGKANSLHKVQKQGQRNSFVVRFGSVWHLRIRKKK